jgi:hypothetical protein
MIWLSWHPDQVNCPAACSYYPAASEEEEEEEEEEDAAATVQAAGAAPRPGERAQQRDAGSSGCGRRGRRFIAAIIVGAALR